MARSTAREMAMQLSFEKLLGGDGGQLSQEMILEQILLRDSKTQRLTKADDIYVGRILAGMEEHQEEIDALIEKNAVNWSIERMAKVDICVLRLAIFELLYEKETPVNVIINEAVNLGTWYSEPASSKFINGILGVIEKSQNQGPAKREERVENTLKETLIKEEAEPLTKEEPAIEEQ